MTMLQQAALQLPMWMGKASERYAAAVIFNTFKVQLCCYIAQFYEYTQHPMLLVAIMHENGKVICKFCLKETSFGLISLNQH